VNRKVTLKALVDVAMEKRDTRQVRKTPSCL
jgi:hypothetical protein